MTRQLRMHKAKWILAAAVAALPLWAAATPARAQFQSTNDGHARDANPRVGSNGRNTGGSVGPAVTGNQIVTGDVTRGFGFRGSVPYSDARAFRVNIAGSGTDRFVALSSGAAVRGAPSAYASSDSLLAAHPFYAESRAVAPPPGFIPLASGGGFVPAPHNVPGLILQRSDNPISADYSMGQGFLPRPGDELRAGPADASNRQTLLTVSPLSGINEITTTPGGDQLISQQSTFQRPNGDRFRTDQQTINQMRSELEATNLNEPQNPNNLNNPNGINNNPLNSNNLNNPNGQKPGDKPATPDPNLLSRPLPQAFETPDSASLNNNSLDSSIGAAPMSGGLQTGQSQFRQLQTPSQQSAQYNELKNRLDKTYQSGRAPTDAQRDSDFLRAQAAQARAVTVGAGGSSTTRPAGAGAAPRPPGGVAPGVVQQSNARPGGAAVGGAATPRPRLVGPKPEPLRITSLATGVKAKGLRDLLRSAEDLMKQGKFASAIDQYDTAAQVAPNNPLVFLGRANAELGASSYRSAENHLRQAFSTDPALLLAQYDLNAFAGEKRVEMITSDLQDLAKSDPKSEMPEFLLAYIAYNTAHPAQAIAHLDEAEKRLRKPDPVIQLMREYWTVPSSTPSNAAPAATPGPVLPADPNK